MDFYDRMSRFANNDFRSQFSCEFDDCERFVNNRRQNDRIEQRADEFSQEDPRERACVFCNNQFIWR